MTARHILDQALQGQEISLMDYHFGCFLAAHDQGGDPLVAALGALVSSYLAMGHSCLPLHQLPALARTWARFGLEIPGSEQIKTCLAQSSVCGSPGTRMPLILDGDNLFLHKYHGFEVAIAQALIRRRSAQTEVDIGTLRQRLDSYFDSPGDSPDWQRVAASIALTRNLAIISGGPGTGKTTTVVKILALLLQANPGSRIRMAAPTGKAAMRLSSSVSQAVEALLSNSHMSPDVGAEMPISASTLHRLLGVNPSQEQNRFNASNPLPVDVMIVDEASMVDITLMEQLVDALPDACRLILLGDKDQLPSIEAGNVLADLCDQASNSYSHDYCKVLTALGNHGLQSSKRAHSLLMDCTCNLKVSHRFPDLSTIGQLARAINSNDSEATRALVNQAQDATGDGAFCFYELSGRALPIDQMVKAYQAFLDISNNPNSTPLEVIRAFSGYQILCGVRSGDSGVEQLNADLEQALRTAGQIRADRWYHGRPVLVTQNDYGLHLFNGDIGITLVDGNGDAIVYFQSGDETVRKVLPARLPAHQTCWAMTIHKTQGSEYERIAIVLPDKSHLTRLEFLSRELLYTAVTRARQQVTIYGYASELDDILAQSARRSSGLAQRLRGELK